MWIQGVAMARMDKWIPGVSPDDRTSKVRVRRLQNVGEEGWRVVEGWRVPAPLFLAEPD